MRIDLKRKVDQSYGWKKDDAKKYCENRAKIWKCLVLRSSVKFILYDVGVDVVDDKNLTPIRGYIL